MDKDTLLNTKIKYFTILSKVKNAIKYCNKKRKKIMGLKSKNQTLVKDFKNKNCF